MRHFYTLHSDVGGSGAKRWMACPGSVRLGRSSSVRDEEDLQEWTAEGVVAHEVAAECLAHGTELWTMAGQKRTAGGHEIEISPEMVAHLQLYLDTIYSQMPADRDAELMVERQVSFASLGYPHAFGTLDCGLVVPADEEGDTLHIFDLKYGAGLFVAASDPQFRYYAGATIATYPELTANVGRIKIWVVQPRIDWAGPLVRSVEFTRAELGEWLEGELFPAIDRTMAPDAPLVPGKDQCQFCKVVMCPKRLALGQELVAATGADPVTVAENASDEQLGEWLAKWQVVKGLGKVLEREAFARMQNRGRKIPGVYLGEGKTHRVGKAGYEAAAIEKWGNRAYKPLEVMTIPQLEKLPDGKKFAQTWGYKPQGAPTLCYAGSNRPEIKGRTAADAFAQVLDKYSGDE